MISQIFTADCFKILSLFSLSPGSRFNRTEIKNRTRLNNVPLDKALLLCLNSGIIVRRGNYYGVNFENELAKEFIEIASRQYKQMRELPLDVYYLLLDFITTVALVRGVEAYLFGSYAKLIYKENSDIDLALLYSRPLDQANITQTASKLEKVYSKKVELHYFKKESFHKNKKDPLVKSILRDGIKLI